MNRRVLKSFAKTTSSSIQDINQLTKEKHLIFTRNDPFKNY